MRVTGPPNVGPSTVRVVVRVSTSTVRILYPSSATNTESLSGRRGSGAKASAVGAATPPAAGPPTASSRTSMTFTPPSSVELNTSYRTTRPSAPTDTSSNEPSSRFDLNAKPRTWLRAECALYFPIKSNARSGSSSSDAGAAIGPWSLKMATHPPASAAAA